MIGIPDSRLTEDVEVLFKGQRVDRLTKTQIMLWNSGNQIVRGEDIVAADPLRFQFSEDAVVLDSKIIRYTREAIKVSTTNDSQRPNCAFLTFDYLDPQDGAIIEILHTARERSPQILGTIRGVPKGVIDWGRIPIQDPLRLPIYLVLPFVIVMFTIGVVLIFYDFVYLYGDSHASLGTSILFAVSSVLYFALSWQVGRSLRRHYPKALSGGELETVAAMKRPPPSICSGVIRQYSN